MKRLSKFYRENVVQLDKILRIDDNFDMLKKVMKIGEDEMTMYYIDGFVKDTTMNKLMQYFLSLKAIGEPSEDCAENFMKSHVPYVETEITEDLDVMLNMVMSGATLMIASGFED